MAFRRSGVQVPYPPLYKIESQARGLQSAGFFYGLKDQFCKLKFRDRVVFISAIIPLR
jgi:hypothetical protein